MRFCELNFGHGFSDFSCLMWKGKFLHGVLIMMGGITWSYLFVWGLHGDTRVQNDRALECGATCETNKNQQRK